MNQSSKINSTSKDNPLNIIDSHCHLDFSQFDIDRENVLEACSNVGICEIVIPGVLASTWQELLNFCLQNNTSDTHKVKLHPTIGLHPMFMNNHRNENIHQLDQLLSTNSIVALGEIGLDFFEAETKHHDLQLKQIELFEAQLKLAKKHDLPVIIHCRKAHDQILKLLKKYQLKGGIAHAFNGSMRLAEEYINLGFKLGFGGMLTYGRSTKLRSLVKELPLEAIVLETDSPDMTVAQHRGERNSPEYLTFVLEAIAEIRKETIQLIATQTTKNVREVLNLRS